MDDVLGRVVAVSGSQMRADVTADQLTEASIRIGSMIKVRSADIEVLGRISAAELDSRGSVARIALSVDLLGEIVTSAEGATQFHRGVSSHPIPGAPVRAATGADLNAVYTRPLTSNVSIGSLYHDATRFWVGRRAAGEEFRRTRRDRLWKILCRCADDFCHSHRLHECSHHRAGPA